MSLCKQLSFILFITFLILILSKNSHSQIPAPARIISNRLSYASVQGNALITNEIPITVEKKYKIVTYIKTSKSPRKTQILQAEPYACNCQKWAAYKLGTHFGYLRAAAIPVNQTTPTVGVAILTRENSRGTNSGHTGVTIDVDYNEKIVTIQEANYVSCRVTTRKLAFNDPRIRGYYKP